jgi:hypothetical protein
MGGLVFLVLLGFAALLYGYSQGKKDAERDHRLRSTADSGPRGDTLPDPGDPKPDTWALGSPLRDVRRLEGPPNSSQKLESTGERIWWYDAAGYVRFDAEAYVVEWRSPGINTKRRPFRTPEPYGSLTRKVGSRCSYQPFGLPRGWR